MRSPDNGSEISPPDAAGQNLVLRNLAILAVLGWLIVAFLRHAYFTGLAVEPITRGFLSGTLFGLVTLIAAWTVFGPLALRWRMTIAAGMLVLLIAAIALNVCFGHLSAWPEVVAVGAVMVVQWALVQGPLWALVIRYELRMTSVAEVGQYSPSRQQFSIRELLVLTTSAAVLMALARVVVGRLDASLIGGFLVRFLPLLALVAVSNSVVAVVCLVASLLPRPIVANLAALFFAGVIAVIEAQAFKALEGGTAALRDYLFSLAFNLFQCAWVVAAAIVLRTGGYRLFSTTGSRATQWPDASNRASTRISQPHNA